MSQACLAQCSAIKMHLSYLSLSTFCLPGQAGQCRAHRVHLVAVAAAAAAVVCM